MKIQRWILGCASVALLSGCFVTNSPAEQSGGSSIDIETEQESEQEVDQEALTENEPIQVESLLVLDKRFEEMGEGYEMHLNYPELQGYENQEVLKVWNEQLSIALTEIDGIKKAVAEELVDGKYPRQVPYEYSESYTIEHNKDAYVSITTHVYQYMGGAHGMTAQQTYHYDLEKESALNLSDFFDSSSDYEDKINAAVVQGIKDEQYEYYLGDEGFPGINGETNFYFDEEGLHVYFQQYEIAPYAAGLPEFVIPYENIEGDLLSRYKFLLP